MSTLARWGKFNLVGVIGAVAQLGSLAVLNRMMPGHYLVASAVALELTLLHNFVWHVQYTWQDRRNQATLLGQCVRFHLSNGMVSLVGNLVLMKLLVAGVRLPVLIANGIAILCCSLVNFSLGETWVFGGKQLRVVHRCEQA
jgi:putative flippase GtrA